MVKKCTIKTGTVNFLGVGRFQCNFSNAPSLSDFSQVRNEILNLEKKELFIYDKNMNIPFNKV